MIFKLAQVAEKSWHRLRGHNQLPKVVIGVKFNDGIRGGPDRKLKPLPPDPSRHQDSAIAQINRCAAVFKHAIFARSAFPKNRLSRVVIGFRNGLSVCSGVASRYSSIHRPLTDFGDAICQYVPGSQGEAREKQPSTASNALHFTMVRL
jgi:hypothetical protein